MSFTYEQVSGRMSYDDEVIGMGYAGRDFDDSGMFVDGKNNPAKENVKGIGPLPAGIYTPIKLFPNHPVVGKYAIQLQPDKATEAKIIAYGRSPGSFFVHGDSAVHPGQASHGCIVLSPDVRKMIWTVRDDITVVSGIPQPDVDGGVSA